MVTTAHPRAASAALAPAQTTSAFATPYVLLRVGGLPIDAADALRFPATAAWADAMLAIEAELDALAQPLTDALQTAFLHHREEQAARRQLIDAKRAVHQRQGLARSQALRAAIPLLAPATQELAVCWLALLERQQQRRAEGAEQFDAELRSKRRVLKQLLHDADFRSGVVLSSADLDQALDKYLLADELQLNKQARRAERSLLEYLYRTSAKTSPFSTLTPVCAGSFCDDPDGAAMLVEMSSMAKQSHVRLHVGVLAQLGVLISADSAQRRLLPVALTPSWQIVGQQLRYLRRRREADEQNADAPGMVTVVHEDVFYLPLTDMLRGVLHALSGGQSATLADLATALSAEGARSQKVEGYLQHLLRLGLLIVPQLQVDIHSRHPLASYRAQLESLGIGAATTAAAHLAAVDELLEQYRVAPPVIRRELLVRVRRQVERCYAELGRPDLRAPRTLVYEDTVLRPERIALNLRRWGTVMQDLEQLQRVLPIFDPNTPRRLVMQGFFRARYGPGARCDDLATFAAQFQSEFFSNYQERKAFHAFFDSAGSFRPRTNDFQLPELDQINAAMQRTAALVGEAQAALPADAAELVLDDSWIAELQPFVPASAGELRSDSFFAQLASDNGEPLLVLNRTYMGLTTMFSRFAHFLNDDQPLVDTLSATLDALLPADAVFAEIKGGYDTTNLNLHPRVTPYEIVCPGEVTLRPADEQIHLDDLYIVDDLAANRLRLFSRHLGREVVPVYLGFLMPLVLPEIQQVLLNFSPDSMSRLNLWAGVPAPEAVDGVAFYPRVRYNQLVLHRAAWRLAPDALPQRDPQECDPDYMLRIERWRRAHHIPERVFATPEGEGGANVYAPYKPFYVDFTSYFSVQLLDTTVRGASQRLVLSEMLPGRDELWLRHQGQDYVSEFVLELQQTTRR